MQLTLSIPDRAFAKSVLEQIVTGSIIEMRLRREGIKALEFTQEEMEQYTLKIEGNVTTWPEAATHSMWTGDISEGVRNLLMGRLEQLSGDKKFHVALLGLADALGIDMEGEESAVPKDEENKQ